MSFNEELQARIQKIEEIINSYLPEEEGLQKTVIEAMNYSVLAGGKRLRPMLMQETYKLFGGSGEIVEPWIMMNTDEARKQHIQFMEKLWQF